jgi:hypothetical protein
MSEIRSGPNVNATVIQIAKERFNSAVEAREAVRKALDEISDDLLRDVRGIQVVVMM